MQRGLVAPSRIHPGSDHSWWSDNQSENSGDFTSACVHCVWLAFLLALLEIAYREHGNNDEDVPSRAVRYQKPLRSEGMSSQSSGHVTHAAPRYAAS
jgi:hypothetical protein